MVTKDPDKKGADVGETSGPAASQGADGPAPTAPPVRSTRSALPDAAKSQGHAARMLAAAPEEQIEAALAAGKYERAADLMQRHGERLLAEGAEELLARCFERVPNALIQRLPRLAVLHAWLLVYTEQYPGAATRISEAERALRSLEMAGVHRWPEDADEVVALRPFADVKRAIGAIRGHLAWIHGDPCALSESVDEVIMASSADHPVWRARALVTLGRCRYLAGALADAAQDLDAALASTGASDQRLARTVGLEARIGLGRVREAQGRLDAAAKLYADVIGQAGDSPEHADPVASAHIGLGRIALAHRDLVAAERALERGLARADETGWLAVALDGLLAWAWVQQASGRPEAVADALNRAERFVKARDRRWAAERVTTERALLLLAQGDMPAVRRWQQASAMRAEDRLGPIREAQRLTKGLVMMALGDADGAAPVLAEVRREAATAGLVALAVAAAVADARCQYARGKKKAAAAALADAVVLAAPSSMIHPFVALGPLPAPLLATLPKPKSDAERALIGALAPPEGPAAAEKPAPAKPSPTAPSKAKKGAPIATDQEVPAAATPAVQERAEEEAPEPSPADQPPTAPGTAPR